MPNTKVSQAIKPREIFIASDVRRSILECRAAYHNLTDLEFAAWYQRRYKVKADAVLAVLGAEGGHGKHGKRQ